MTEEKEFDDYLKNFNGIAASLACLLVLSEKAEEQKSFAKDELLNSMKQKIITNCSAEFVSQMKKEVSEELKNISLFGSDSKTNLDYLVEVIFLPLTQSPRVIGLDHFIAPGENYEKSCEFCNKFFKDFVEVKELFRIELRERSDVKIGYAMEFYRP